MGSLQDKFAQLEKENKELNDIIASHVKVRNYLYIACGVGVIFGIWFGRLFV